MIASYLTGELTISDAAQLILTSVLGITVRSGVAKDVKASVEAAKE